MFMKRWSLPKDLKQFDVGESGAKPGEWRGQEALYLEGFHTNPVLLHDPIPSDCFRLRAEVAIPGPYGFIGLAFGARDTQNYELVYFSPGTGESIGDIQYDPIMNGSSTWQIYNGPVYQAAAPVPAGEWVTITLEVRSRSVAIYVGDAASPQLVISNLQHGPAVGRIGMWGNFPGYIRSLAVEEIQPEPANHKQPDLQHLADETFVTEWMVSPPYTYAGSPGSAEEWTKILVEENGTVNLNRINRVAEKGIKVQASCTFTLPEEQETMLTFGFSDHVRLWINDEKVYEGKWKWGPPESDGRIRPGHAAVAIRWKSGLNTIRAEITNLECMFGWGLSVKTGLSNIS